MSKRPDDGGPAFPMQEGSIMNGLSARDWFAGQALAGCNSDDQELVAKWCYEMADVMLAVRNREKGEDE